jgi:cyclopropane fatty-acyl-phospholipid synthase-like methyltransferase
VNSTTTRKDVAWQREDTVASYGQSQKGIPFTEEQFDLMGRVLRAHDVSVHRVLDLGCGDGIATQALADRYDIDVATLVDFSEPMLAAARARFAPAAFELHVVYGDMLESAWVPDVEAHGPYDVVVSRYAIHHLPHERKRTLYGEILAMLRPGGMFINMEHVKSPNTQYQAAFDQMLVDGIHALATDQQTKEDVERAYRNRQDAETNILAPVEEQCQWLRDLGYVDVDCFFKALELAAFAGRRPAV